MALPVSGPGPFSQRTDRQAIQNLPNPDYGEGKAYKQLEQGAPMAAAPGMPTAGGFDISQLLGNPADRVTPLTEGTAMPGTPVTDGAALGPGAGTPPVNLEQQQRNAANMPFLEWMANQPGSSDSARNLIRQMKYSM
jgi:hypothetical protein